MREKSATLIQIGISLIVIGFVIQLALSLAFMMRPIAGFAIIAGIVLAVIGALTPGRRH